MLKGLKLRIYPTTNQQDYINNLLGSYRFVYNQSLNFSIEYYKSNKKSVNLKLLGEFLFHNLLKNNDYSFLNNHNTKILNQSVIVLLDSYKRFFINGNGFPNYKSKHHKQSCKIPLQAISKRNDYLSNRLTLTKELKNLRFRCSDKYRTYLNEYKDFIKSATLSKSKSGNYHLSILIDIPNDKQIPKPNNNFIGIDMGIKDFIIDSNGNRYENLKSIRTNQYKISKLQKRLSKKQNKSKNKEKCRIRLAKYYEKLNNIKINYLHEISNKLISENQVICIEDLNVKGMMKNKNLAKSIQELSINQFVNMLKYKNDWYNRDLVQIDRYFPSSKLCNCCGYKNNELTLKDREWQCQNCQVLLDRDINAAINIRKEGQRIYNNKIPMSDGKYKPLENTGYGFDEEGRIDMVLNTI